MSQHEVPNTTSSLSTTSANRQSLKALNVLDSLCTDHARTRAAVTLFTAALEEWTSVNKLAAATNIVTGLFETLVNTPNPSDSAVLRPAMGLAAALGFAYLLAGDRERGLAYFGVARNTITTMKHESCRRNATEWLDSLLVLSGEHELVNLTPVTVTDSAAPQVPSRPPLPLVRTIADKIKHGDITAAWLTLDQTQDDLQLFLDALELAVNEQAAPDLFTSFKTSTAMLPKPINDAFRLLLAVPLARAGAPVAAAACVAGLSEDQDAAVRRDLVVEVAYTIAAKTLADR